MINNTAVLLVMAQEIEAESSAALHSLASRSDDESSCERRF